MLSRLGDDQIYLEDLDGDVRLDLSEANQGAGIFTETTFALVIGTYEAENLFKVSEMALPPPELRKNSMYNFKNDFDL